MTLKSMNVISKGRDFVTIFWTRLEQNSPYVFQTLTIKDLKQDNQIGFVRKVLEVSETDITNPVPFHLDGKKNFRAFNAISRLSNSASSIELNEKSLEKAKIIMPSTAVAIGSDVEPFSSIFILSEPEEVNRKEFTFVKYSNQRTVLLPDASVLVSAGGRNGISRKNQRRFWEEIRDGLKNNYDENLKLFYAMYEEVTQERKK